MTAAPERGRWQSARFSSERLMADAARRALLALQEPALAPKAQAFVARRMPRLAVSFKMPEPVGRGRCYAGGGTLPLEDLDEVLAVFGLADGLFLHSMVPRARVPEAPAGGALADILEAVLFDSEEEKAWESLPLYDGALLSEALAEARAAAQDAAFPALAFVQEHANRHCDGSEDEARRWLRGLAGRLGRLTFGV